jgi:hypothetical protein
MRPPTVRAQRNFCAPALVEPANFPANFAAASGTASAISRVGGMQMKANVVLLDRTIRLGLGMLLLASPLLELPTYPFNLLGLVLVATALVGYCPIYGLFSALAPASVKTPPAPRLRSVKG